MKQLLHLLHILRVLARHDALFFAERLKLPLPARAALFLLPRRKRKGREGERLAAAFTELGPFFIKFGQALSVRSDVVGEDIAEDLSRLQDRLPSFPATEAKATIARELGQPVDALFAEFEEVPVAAASISQVHFAIDKQGNKLAVKVLRPGIEARFARDVALLRFLARRADKRRPEWRRLKLRQVVDNFAQTVSVEMDLRMEAAAACEFCDNMAQGGYMLVPAVHWNLTARRVLTLERIHGISIDDVAVLKGAGHDADAVLRKASAAFFQQVFRDGFFHADLHPGNLFVGEDGGLIAVDFGIMARVDRRTRIFLAEMLKAFLDRDYTRVAEVHFEAGYIPADQDVLLFAQACRAIGEPLFGKAQKDISLAHLLAQLFKVSEDFQMETQPQLLLLQKTMMLAEGVGRRLNPEVNFWELSRPLIEEWMRANLGMRGQAKDALAEMREAMGKLRHLHECITPEGLRLHPDTVRALKAEPPSGKGWNWPFCGAMLLAVVILSS